MRFVVIAVLLGVSLPPKSGTEPRHVSEQQAELLCRTAASSTGVSKLKGFSLERARMEQFPDFYFFDALVSEPGAEGFSGHYAVNKITAEVWDPYACSRFSSPQLSDLQRKIRKEVKVSAKAYQEHAKENPCLNDARR